MHASSHDGWFGGWPIWIDNCLSAVGRDWANAIMACHLNRRRDFSYDRALCRRCAHSSEMQPLPLTITNTDTQKAYRSTLYGKKHKTKHNKSKARIENSSSAHSTGIYMTSAVATKITYARPEVATSLCARTPRSFDFGRQLLRNFFWRGTRIPTFWLVLKAQKSFWG